MVNKLDEIITLSYKLNEASNSLQMGLFKEEDDDILSRLGEPPPVNKTQRLLWEREYLGIYLTGHPLDDYKNIIGKVALTASQINNIALGTKVKICGFVSRIQKVRTKSGQIMVFSQVSDYNKSIEVIFFPTVLANYGANLSEDKIVIVEGRLDRRNGEYQIIGDRIEQIQPLEG